ncbi:MAG: Trk system potassium transporter TrkA [Bryobacteraceae bacterium]|nr:Trk system potassium transporter TrkA [Bryobacteraceae bacterium]
MRVLIAGGGEVGEMVARRLSREGNEVTIIEASAERCAYLDHALDAKVVRGSASSFRHLKAAGADQAEMLIAVTSSDEANLLACLVAQAEFNVRVKVARIRTHEVDDWRRVCSDAKLEIDLVIHPESEALARIRPVLRIPGVSEVIQFGGGRIRLFSLGLDSENWVTGKTLLELSDAGPPKNSLVAMIFRGNHAIIPHGDETLLPDDRVYVVTTDRDLRDTLRFMGLQPEAPLARVFVLGGKQLGILVAMELEREGVSVKLFERDAARCELVSGLLDRTVVIHGDGSDAATLIEQNIEGVDAYLALTGDDENNLITGLLARRLGARKIVTLLNRTTYLPLAHRLGIQTVVNPRLATVDRIMQFVRKGRVHSVTTFGEEAAEAIELEASPNGRYIGRRLKEIRLPREAVVGAIMRPDGEVLIPRGDDVIRAGDRVIFFALERVVPYLEEAFIDERRAGRR